MIPSSGAYGWPDAPRRVLDFPPGDFHRRRPPKKQPATSTEPAAGEGTIGIVISSMLDHAKARPCKCGLAVSTTQSFELTRKPFDPNGNVKNSACCGW